MTILSSIIHLFLTLILSPLLIGIINRTKALFAGRKGQPLLQPYYDLIKLMKKGSVYSTTSTWVFRLGPVMGLSAVMISILIVPSGGVGGLLSFSGDFVFMAYALGLTRFVTVLAAMDTGSPFEGMGASREVQFAIIAEVVLLLGLAVLAIGTHEINLSGIYAGLWTKSISPLGPVSVIVAFAFLTVLLTENARIPVDDPNTHLELTMIHEVMVLDHGGVDLAFIQYGASLKLWLFSALLVGIAIPLRTGLPLVDVIVNIIGILAIAVLVGIIESCMARLRLLHVPQMLVVALSVTVAALLWILR
ncbi:MAG: hydrogenase [Desulfobacterium sp.]|nr:hydrogenase [Desulfobacterium sp.]MBU3947342.1 NADH-quinone oxidoreductase subunit H [Pseudomonadota bacterium]